MTQLFPRQTVYGSSQTMSSTGDGLVIKPGRPIVIVEWGYIVSTALVGTSGTATLNKRPTAGSTTGQTVGSSTSSTSATGATQYSDVAGGQMTIPATSAGKGLMHRISLQAPPSSGVSGQTGTTSPAGLLIIPGQEAAINLGTALGTSGAAFPFITYYELPSVGDSTAVGNDNNMVNVTFVQV